MMQVTYKFKGNQLTKTFFNHKLFSDFIGMIRLNPEVKDIQILNENCHQTFKKVA